MSDIGLNVALGATSWAKGKIADSKATALAEEKARIQRINDMNIFKEKEKFKFDFKNNPINVATEGTNVANKEAYTLRRADELKLPDQKGRQASEEESSKQMTTINFLDRIKEGTGKTNREIIAESKASTLTTNIEKGIPNLEGATEGLSEQSKLAISLGLRFDATAQEIRERQSLFKGLNEREQRAFKVGLPRTATDDEIQIAENAAEARKKIEIADKLSGTSADPAGVDLRKEQAETQDTASRYLTQLVTEGVYEGNVPVFGNQPNTPGIIDRNESRQLAMDYYSSAQGGIKITIDRDTIKLYNKWSDKTGNKKINPDLPYIMIKTESDPIFKDVSEEKVSIDLINQYRAMPAEVFNNLPNSKKSRIQNKLKQQLYKVFKLNNAITVGANGAQVISETTTFNWQAIGIDWDNLPSWVHKATKKEVNQRIDNPKNVVKFVQLEDGTTEMKVTSTEISSQDVADIEEKTPNATLTIEDAAVLAYAKAENMTIEEVKASPGDLKIALSLVADSPVQIMGTRILHDLLYMNNTSFVPRKFQLSGPRRDKILQELNGAAIKTARDNKPAVMGMSYDPRIYHTTKLDMFAAAIDNEYIVKTIAQQIGNKGGESISGFMNSESLVTIKAMAAHYGINLEKARAANTFSDPAYSTGIRLMESLENTQIGSSAAETLTLIKAGVSSLPRQLQLALGGWVSDVETSGEVSNPDTGNVLFTSLNETITGITQNYKGANAGKLRNTFEGATERAQTYYKTQPGEGDLPGRVAEQKMLHAALVFYTAAAFQGEGGKAISDGDRKFVEWALGYGMFSTVETRQAAIMGMLAIIAKADTINSYLTSGDPRKFFVAANYNQVHGDNVIHPNDWPTGEGAPANLRGKFTNSNVIPLNEKSNIALEKNVAFTNTIENANTNKYVSSGLASAVNTDQTDVEMQSTFEPYRVEVDGGGVPVGPKMTSIQIVNGLARLKAKNSKESNEAVKQIMQYYSVDINGKPKGTK